jgi:replicative DNA helicase
MAQMEKIYDITKVNMLFGCLLKDTSLIHNEKYPLCKEDFVGFAFDSVLYVSIVNLSRNGYKTISFFDLDKYLQKHEAQYEIFKDCREKGYVDEFLDTIMDLSNLENYESYYNDVRKLSCIRDCRESGYDID